MCHVTCKNVTLKLHSYSRVIGQCTQYFFISTGFFIVVDGKIILIFGKYPICCASLKNICTKSSFRKVCKFRSELYGCLCTLKIFTVTFSMDPKLRMF